MTKTAKTRWPRQTTMENLETYGYATQGAVLKYGDHALAVGFEGQGYHAAVYEFIDSPEETGLGDIECMLNLVETATELFEDGGHAMAWCMKKI